MMKIYICLGLSFFFIFTSSCQWFQHQEQIDRQLEDIGVEAAKDEVDITKKLAEKEIGK
jgi:hypothetical protein